MHPKRQRVALAFLGSVLLHGIALLIFAVIVALQPPAPPAPPPDDPIKLEVAQEDPPATPPPILEPEATPIPTTLKLVEATGPDTDSHPSADAVRADRTTKASSPEQSDGKPPGATQAGKRMASFQFDPRPPALGIVSRAEPPAPTLPPLTAPALPQPDRFVHRPDATPRPDATVPPPAATPAPTAAPDEFAMAMATPSPPPEDPFDPSIRSTSPPLPKPLDRPSGKTSPTPPVGSLRSAENGSSNVRGPGGVDTLATPASRYTYQVTQMIKSIWSRAVERRRDRTFGAAIIHCTIDKDGLVISPRIVSNTADVLFGSIALQAVVVARLPPMPEDVAQELHGKLGLDITFDLTPLPQEAALH